MKRQKIDEERKLQAEKAEKERKRKENEKAQQKKINQDWLIAGIETKEKLNKALDVNQKELVSKAKGAALADCFSLWMNEEIAGEYDKKQYVAWVQSITDVDDPKYDKLVQINSALNGCKQWVVLRGIIETIL